MTNIIVLTIILGFLAKLIIPLCRNYIAAQKTGQPLVTSLIDPTSALRALTKNIVIPYLTLLPGHVGHNAELNFFGWQFRAKHSVHQRLGTVFVQVTPSNNIVNIADPDLVQQVFQRIDDFPKPRQIYRRLEVFGPNLDSLNGDDWKRHRKLTAPAFNERVSSLVWEEGSRQAHQLLRGIYATSSRTTKNATRTCQTIAHHVLAYAGFGVRSEHSTDVNDLPPGHQLAYNDALCTVLANIVLAIVIPARVLAYTCEICTAMLRYDLAAAEKTADMSALSPAATMLSDGAAAFVLCNDRGREGLARGAGEECLQLLGWKNMVVPHTHADVGFFADPNGYRTILGRGVVANHIKKAIGLMLPNMLSSCHEAVGIAGLSPSDFDWAMHPGSPVIVDGIKEMLELENDHVRVTNEVYKSKGNSGSVSVLAVLSQMLSKEPRRDHIISAAYGPGINVEMVVLKRCPRNDSDSD